MADSGVIEPEVTAAMIIPSGRDRGLTREQENCNAAIASAATT
jgi:hypothetical protein